VFIEDADEGDLFDEAGGIDGFDTGEVGLLEAAGVKTVLEVVEVAGRGTSPAGLVYWAFHQGKDQKPRKKYCDLDNADRYLPESFMRQSGQWKFIDEEDQNE